MKFTAVTLADHDMGSVISIIFSHTGDQTQGPSHETTSPVPFFSLFFMLKQGLAKLLSCSDWPQIEIFLPHPPRVLRLQVCNSTSQMRKLGQG